MRSENNRSRIRLSERDSAPCRHPTQQNPNSRAWRRLTALPRCLETRKPTLEKTLLFAGDGVYPPEWLAAASEES